MSYNNKPTILIAHHYDKKISVEFDHADTDLNEVMDAVETLVIGMGFHKDSLKNWILEKSDEYRDDEFDKNYSFDFPESYIDEAISEHNSIEELDDDGYYDDYGMRTHNHD